MPVISHSAWRIAHSLADDLRLLEVRQSKTCAAAANKRSTRFELVLFGHENLMDGSPCQSG